MGTNHQAFLAATIPDIRRLPAGTSRTTTSDRTPNGKRHTISDGLFGILFLKMALALGCGLFSLAQAAPKLSWLDRATLTRASQPDWVTPLITASANLEEAVSRQIA
jgi:hypothetical protein